MDQRELEGELVKLIARNVAQRDVIARLLAYVARREADAVKVLEDFSNAGDARIDRFPPPNATSVEIAEAMRRENDLIVEAARTILEP